MKRLLVLLLSVSLLMPASLLPSQYLAPAGVMDTGIPYFIDDLESDKLIGGECPKINPYPSVLKKRNNPLFKLLGFHHAPAAMEMTDELAKHAEKYLPDRDLRVYYPAAGWDPTALLVALELIERDKIDKATFFYEDDLGIDLVKSYLIPDIKKIKSYVEGLIIDEKENEFSISFKYKGKPIHLTYYQGDCLEVLEKRPHDLNLLYFHGFPYTYADHVFHPMWRKFFAHCSMPITIFTYVNNEHILELVSDWYMVAENFFSGLDRWTGAVFGLDKTFTLKQLDRMWAIFEDHKTFRINSILPGDEFDQMVVRKALREIEAYEKHNEENVTTKELEWFFSEKAVSLKKITELQNIGEFKIMAIHPRMKEYVSCHMAAAMCRHLGVDLDNDLEGRQRAVKKMLYVGEGPTNLEYVFLVGVLLRSGMKVEPAEILDFPSKLTETEFKSLKYLYKYHMVRGYDDKLLGKALKKIKEAEDPHNIKYYTSLCISLLSLRQTQKAFAKDKKARDRAFVLLLKDMYEIAGKKSLDEQFFTALMVFADMLIAIDIDRILQFLQDTQTEKEIIRSIDYTLIDRIFMPILTGINNLSLSREIRLSGDQKEMIDTIFNIYQKHDGNKDSKNIMGHIFSRENRQLRQQLLGHLKGDKNSEEILSYMMGYPRHLFLPTCALCWSSLNIPFFIGREQRNIEPLLALKMIQASKLKKGEKVLEIGTGSGQMASIISRMVGKRGHVYTIEIDDRLGRAAKENIKRLKLDNVSVYGGDGGLGLLEKAPFDAIIISCGIPESKVLDFSNIFKEQVGSGSRIVMPITRGNSNIAFIDLYEIKRGKTEVTRISEKLVDFIPIKGLLGPEDNFIDFKVRMFLETKLEPENIFIGNLLGSN